MADALTFVERSSRHESIDESTKTVFQLPTSRESTRASYFGCADDCCNSVSYCRYIVETARARDATVESRIAADSQLQPQERPTEPRGQLRKAAPGANPTACPLPPPAPRLPERASPPACCCSK